MRRPDPGEVIQDLKHDADEAERNHVRGISGVFDDPAEQARYISDGLPRMRIVLRLLSDLPDLTRVLELGSNPYVMTTLITRRFAFELELANYFGEHFTDAQSVHQASIDAKPVEFPFRHFNIERDRFPYPDGRFDCVLFCEILEHLLINPDRAVSEMARILRPGGFLMVSTPNATRLPNLFFLAQGRSIWEWYSNNGPYGRHNREFTLSEVQDLLERNGFDIFRFEVSNLQHLARRYTWLQWMRPSVWNEHLFVVGRRRSG